MPERTEQFEVPINDLGDFVRVVIRRDGKAIRHFVVQYEALIDEEERPVVRYDTAHGFAHRDIVGWDRGTVHWDRMRDVDYNTALTEAIEDLTANWERYRADFLRRRP
jgi:hypothetical protein